MPSFLDYSKSFDLQDVHQLSWNWTDKGDLEE